MGRRLNISTPTVIETTLTPLSDTFSIEASDTLEQWYYVNTGQYKPNRQSTPLILTPVLSALDTDTRQMHTPEWYLLHWYYWDASNSTDYSQTDSLWPGLHWVQIPAQTMRVAGADYFYQLHAPEEDARYNNPHRQLIVMKNVPPTTAADSGAQVCCVGQYIDPRDAGTRVVVRSQVLLTTNQDATTDQLTISLLSPTKTLFSPLSSEGSTYTFRARVLDQNNADVTENYYIEWYAKEDSTTPVLIDTLWCYKKAVQEVTEGGVTRTVGQGTDTIVLDAMYTEHIDIVCRVRQTSTAPLLPPVAYCGLLWDIPRIDVYTKCDMGKKVNRVNRSLRFDNIVNHRHRTLSEEVKSDNLLFHYMARVPQVSANVVTFADRDMGWGQSVSAESRDMAQTTTYSTPVHAEVYMLGAYRPVTEDGEEVTEDGETVFDRN